ncbi:MAG: glutamine-hydrolyzing carbamoyl-phosphate synthase small subunit [Dissulfurispiraceae bacterium]|jgi:carbamoyl-phosphate synthase small subunit|nr:glutamine-hydrolyzing carbamoyl-phosphate synthase small subunit [Dissulfurispiraceae bacterium]
MGRAILVLKDGTVFEGKSFGAETEAIGEVVFNTSMTGYQEIITDPSYKGQIVAMTYTQIGSYGVNDQDDESATGPKAEALVVREYIDYPSSWRSESSLGSYIEKFGIPGIHGIDTRALTRHLRSSGSQMGIVSAQDFNINRLTAKVRAYKCTLNSELVRCATDHAVRSWENSIWSWTSEGFKDILAPEQGSRKMVVYDFGVKHGMLRNLVEAGFQVIVVPADTPAEAVLELKPDALLLSNGPGDPAAVEYAIENSKKLIGRLPVFGISLGHQILGLALGGRTYKLKSGHHGANHPVKDIATGRVAITTQNHNYCVDINSLKGKVSLTHKNLYDGTEEGMQHVELPLFSVQHYPETDRKSKDSSDVFDRFHEIIKAV